MRIADSHHLRARVVAEMHMRRMPPLVAPVTMTQTVRLLTPAERDAEIAHLETLATIVPDALTIRHRDVAGRSEGGVEILWERHSEATTATVISPADPLAPFNHCPAADRALQWLETAPGGVIRAARIAIVRDEAAAEAIVPTLGFAMAELVSCRLGTARLWSDFHIHEDGYGRLLVAAGDVAPTDLGRLVQRIQELGNYRNLALLGLPLVQSESEKLLDLESALAQIAGQMSDDADDAAQLDELCVLSAQVAAITTATGFRLSATAAYAQIVHDRLSSLDCVDINGFQSLAEFTDRRLLPAVRTCASFAQRLETLSVRIERATSLLRTRVDLAMQAQNVELLRSMDASASRQLSLQRVVEGLSVVAASYYTLGLLGYFFPLFSNRLGISEHSIAALAVVPVFVLIFAFLRWRSRRVIDRRNERH